MLLTQEQHYHQKGRLDGLLPIPTSIIITKKESRFAKGLFLEYCIIPQALKILKNVAFAKDW